MSNAIQLEIKERKHNSFKLIICYLGIFLTLLGLILLIPLIILPFYPQEVSELYNFLIPGLSTFVLGILLILITRTKASNKQKLKKVESITLVFLIWLLAIIISAIPYFLKDNCGDFNFLTAVFETTSGYSTTGLTMISTPEECPHIYLLYRAITFFFGGIGLILVLTSIINDTFGLSLFSAEGHNDRLLPNLVKTARVILGIYLLYAIIGSLLLMLFGMEPFDAVCQAVAAISTGGASTKSLSIAYFSNFQYSLGIELTIIVLMIFGSTNFMVHLLCFTGKFKKAINNLEFKVFLFEFAIVVPILIALFHFNFDTGNIANSFRAAIFQFVSGSTGTGFTTITFANLAPINSSAIFLVLTISMLIGGQTNSASGGLKLYRVGVAVKQFFWTIRDMFSPKNSIHSNTIYKHGECVEINQEERNNVFLYIFIFMSFYFFGVLCFAFMGYPIGDSMFEFASALSNTGFSLGITSPSLHPFLIVIEILGMLLGRLEILIVIIFFGKIFDFRGRLNNV